MARKKDQYGFLSEQLDLIIVVDRLLTGFDAPSLFTLFIDRPLMRPHNLIQAFSRSNRLLDKVKKYGQIVTYQTPKMFEEKVKEALVLYSNGGENDVLAPVWEEARQTFILAIEELREVAPSPDKVNLDDIHMLKKFAKAYQVLDKTFSSVQVYSEFEESHIGSIFPIHYEVIEYYQGKYQNALEAIKVEKKDDNGDPIEIDIEYELQSIKTEEINYEYILMLIQSFVPSGKDVYELIPDRDEKSIAEVNMKQSTTNKVIQTFSQEWCVNEDDLGYVVSNYNPDLLRQDGEAELKSTSDYTKYREINENPVSKLRYWTSLRQKLDETVKGKILPLK